MVTPEQFEAWLIRLHFRRIKQRVSVLLAWGMSSMPERVPQPWEIA